MHPSSVYSISSANSGPKDLEELLIAKAKLGDQAAFGELYNLYFKRIYRFIYFRVSHKEVAEDLAEEVFLKAYSKIGLVNQNSSFEGWLYQIARNSVIDYYREKKHIVALEEIENTLEYETNVVDFVNLQEQQKVFLKLLRELTMDQQVILKMKFLENLENDEIAEILGKTEGSIRVIQHRAILKLQELIKKLHSND